MKSLWSVAFLLIALIIGPVAIVTLLPNGGAPDAQPILIAMIGCFVAGVTATLLGVAAVVGAHSEIERIEEDLTRRQPEQSHTGKGVPG